MGVGGYYYLLPSLDDAKENADLAQVKMLTQTCQTYKLENDSWPPNLEALTQPKPDGGRPYVEESALQPRSVPNGQFQYDPSGTHNHGEKPDIWVDGPHGPIGNWMNRVEHN
jgi:hypothetical protein